MAKERKNYTVQEAVKLARDYAEIMDGLRYYETRNDAGIIEEDDTKDLARVLRKVNKFRLQYGEDFFNRHFKRQLERRFQLSILEAGDGEDNSDDC